MKDEEIDEVLRGARIPDGPEPDRLKRVAEAIEATLQPVLPLPPRWMLTAGVLMACAGVAVAGGARAGFLGIEKMVAWERVLIFSLLGILVIVAANDFVDAMIPGSRRRISACSLLGVGTLSLIGVFALSFRNYQTTHFISAGVVCLITGLLHAILAAILSALILRRGFAVSPISAGSIAGTLAGLAGLGVLELHCPNFQAAHVLVWHTAVVPLSAAGGALSAWVLCLVRRAGR